MGKPPPQGFDPVIIDYYNQVPEEVRLEQGPFQLEEARTRELIQRFAPAPPGIVVDVGGAAGAYALWLAGAGYSVHLVDLVPRLVEEAHRRSAGATRPLVSCRVGDARALEIPGDSADMVLLLGPLYHQTDPADRARSLLEVARVLKPGGWLFAAAISRWASALDGLARDLLRDPRFATIVEQDLRDGQHRNPTDRLDYAGSCRMCRRGWRTPTGAQHCWTWPECWNGSRRCWAAAPISWLSPSGRHESRGRRDSLSLCAELDERSSP